MKFIKELFKSITLLILLAIILCLVYPLSIYLISNIFYKTQAHGSLIEKNGKIIGSDLLGQKFISPYYFCGRPSIADYDGINSGASNFGPTSKALLDSVEANVFKYKSRNSLLDNIVIPIDAITYSASGLDPHISYENAILQADRIAKNRNVSLNAVEILIEKHLIHKSLFSRDRINVLKLNITLDEAYPLKLSIEAEKKLQ